MVHAWLFPSLLPYQSRWYYCMCGQQKVILEQKNKRTYFSATVTLKLTDFRWTLTQAQSNACIYNTLFFTMLTEYFANVAKNSEKGSDTRLEFSLQGSPYWSMWRKSLSRLPQQILIPLCLKKLFSCNLTKETSCLTVMITSVLIVF